MQKLFMQITKIRQITFTSKGVLIIRARFRIYGPLGSAFGVGSLRGDGGALPGSCCKNYLQNAINFLVI